MTFTATIKRYAQQGEKSGWTYIEVPSSISNELSPGNRKGFRVKGKIDAHAYAKTALLPVGDGNFIMTLNAAIRKGVQKPVGASVVVKMAVDHTEIQPPAELLECLEDEPEAMLFFKSLSKGHQNYFTNWINSAKTEPTKTKRIAASLDAFIKKWDFGQMLRARKNMDH